MTDSYAAIVAELREGELHSLSGWRGALADRLEALSRSGGGWQPIATAPKDGTRVLIYDGEFVTIARYSQNSNRWYNPQHSRMAPEGWQPLPAPPQAGEGMGEK